MSNLGTLYEEDPTLCDYAEAARWFRKAADAGDAAAMVDLGALFVHGQGVAKDPGQGAEWFRKAAALGNRNGMRNLGALHAGGRGVPLDLAKAVALFRQAAAAGDPESMSNLGTLYARGGEAFAAEITAALMQAAGLDGDAVRLDSWGTASVDAGPALPALCGVNREHVS